MLKMQSLCVPSRTTEGPRGTEEPSQDPDPLQGDSHGLVVCGWSRERRRCRKCLCVCHLCECLCVCHLCVCLCNVCVHLCMSLCMCVRLCVYVCVWARLCSTPFPRLGMSSHSTGPRGNVFAVRGFGTMDLLLFKFWAPGRELQLC